MKRFLDFAFAVSGLVFLTPLLSIAWLSIVLTSGFPGVFCQNRIGLGGRAFTLYKLRTMNLLERAERGSFDAGSTARITRIGKILRKTKLDELPQLWNVVRGDMSLVGPRPEVEKWIKVYPDRWAKVLTVRPGVTDNASIEFRDEEEILAISDEPERTYRDEILPRKLKYYESYVENHSIAVDFSIILKTLFSLFRSRNYT